MNKFIERLKELRKDKNISRRQLALTIGVSSATVSRWESGKMSPTLENIVAICKGFDISSDYLIGLID